MTAKTPLQIAAANMRKHWYACEDKYGHGRGMIHCIPGYSHPRCDEGVSLEKEYLRLCLSEVDVLRSKV